LPFHSQIRRLARRPRRLLVVVAALLLLFGVGAQQSVGTPATNADEVGEWSNLVSWPAMAKHMILLPYDKALIFSTGDDVQLWNIGSNTFKPVPATFGDLHCAGHVTLADGSALVVGGQEGSPFIGTKITATFDPVTESWTNRTPMHYARWYPTITTLPDGRVLSTGGTDEGKGKVRIPEIYDPTTDTWTELPGAAKTQPLYPFMYVDPTSGRLYDAAPAARTEFLDIAGGGSWSPGPMSGWDNLAGGCCSEAGAMYDIGKIIRTGGGDPAHNRTGVIDLTAASPTWRETAPMAFARRRQNLVILADGNVMAVGGTAASDDPARAVLAGEIWDRDTETWTTVASMSTPRMYHSSAMLLPDGRVVAAGGDHPNATSKLTAQFFSPPYLYKGPRPEIATAPDEAGYGATFTIDTATPGISSVALIRSGAPTHAIDMNQRYVPLTFSQNGASLSVQVPASGKVAPPGYYMLVIENADGVPSAGRWIKIGSAAGPPPPPANRAPTANFTASRTAGPAPLDVSFSDTSADGPESWEWDFTNNGTIDSTVRNPQFTYPAAGSYTVRLVVRNAFGSDEEVKLGYINVGSVAPPPGPGQTKTFVAVADARVQEANPTKNAGNSYLRVDGAADPDIESYFRFDVSGIGGQVTSAKLRVLATSSSSNAPAAYGLGDGAGDWVENTITWANRPARASAALDDKGSVKKGIWLEYDVTPRVTGDGSVTFVLATDSTDGLDVSSREVVDPANRPQLVVNWADEVQKPPRADFSVSPASGTAPLTVTFTDTSDGATSWAWDFTNDDSFESSAQNPTFTYADPGVYSVRLFVENDFGGDEVIKTAVVTVTEPGPPPPTTTTTVVSPIADAYVKSDEASKNYGKSSSLRIDSVPQVNGYVRFDVTGLTGPIVSATLRLFVVDAGSNAGALYPVSPLWIETGTGALTWANAPALMGTPLAGGGAAALNTWVEWDVSSAVAGNGAVAFAVKGLTPDAAYFSSKEGAKKAELVIETADPATAGARHARH
jgi:PKD repeat protein